MAVSIQNRTSKMVTSDSGRARAVTVVQARRVKPPTSDARAFFKVVPDLVESGTWTLRRNGRVIRRMATKSEVVRAARQTARERGNSVLEIRRANGTFAEYNHYN